MSAKAETGWVLDPDDPSERLHSLTLALVRTEVGLTKEEIFSSIRGYRFDLDKQGGLDGNLSALHKKFERDKDMLREIGVRIDAAGSGEGDADYRYRISRDVFSWPEGAKLSSKQLQLLELAASVWDQAALSPEATQAITRLRAIADLGEVSASNAISPRINTVEPSFVPLKRSIEESNGVHFTYRRSDGHESIRHIQPWQLHHTNGLWILLGWDIDRQAPRNFLLKRIHSKVSRTKNNFEAPSDVAIKEAKAELLSHYAKNVAKIRVTPGTTAAMHFETHESSDGVATLNYLDLQLLAEELLEFGPSIQVLEPKELKELIREILRKVIDEHA